MSRNLADLLPHPRRPRPGILHLGPGAFFRAHLAVYTEGAMQASGGDWGILAAGLRNGETARQLTAQAGCFTLLVRDGATTRAQVLGAVLGGVAPEVILARMQAPEIRIVTLTLTEKAYGLDPSTGGLDLGDPVIAADLAGRAPPRSAVGLIAEGLAARRAAGLAPFTPLSCDNLPGNGHLLRRLVLDYAMQRDPALADWIATQVPFPATMVDRITPATSDRERRMVREDFGIQDEAPVFCEDFIQWVLEDNFPAGRPPLEKAGVEFVADVTPWELMKIRILNGGHAVIAYPAGLLDIHFVHEAMEDAQVRAFLEKIEADEIIPAVPPVPGTDLQAYFAKVASPTPAC